MTGPDAPHRQSGSLRIGSLTVVTPSPYSGTHINLGRYTVTDIVENLIEAALAAGEHRLITALVATVVIIFVYEYVIHDRLGTRKARSLDTTDEIKEAK